MAAGRVRPAWDLWLVVALGGALGSLGRWTLGRLFPFHPGASWPVGTLIANGVGSFALGIVTVIVLELRPWSRLARPFWGVGVCGGFTTFSTYLWESQQLVAGGRFEIALAYAVGSVLVGLVALALGMLLARRVGSRVEAASGRPS